MSDLNIKTAKISVEYEIIMEAIIHCRHNKSKAAKHLGIDRKTLYNKLKKYEDLNKNSHEKD